MLRNLRAPPTAHLRARSLSCSRPSRRCLHVRPRGRDPKRRQEPSKFSRLLDFMGNEAVPDKADNNGRVPNDPRNYEIQAFKNTPVFTPAAHNSVEALMMSSSEAAGDVDQASTPELMPQYGLLGALQQEPIAGGASPGALKEKLAELQAREHEYRSQVDPVDRLVLANMDVPWSSFICGSQGSGKSHTLSCLLENALISDGTEGTPATPGSLPNPLAAMQFHYDSFTSESTTQVCEAAYLCSNGRTPVTILVSPSNIWAMKRLYENLPGLPPDAPRPRVLPLYLSEDQLSIGRMLKLMAVNPNKTAGGNSGPLYMEVVRSIIREMAMEGPGFTYAGFRERLEGQRWLRGQENPLNMRLQLLDSFMAPSDAWTHSTRPAASDEDIWDFKPGSLTIVDLSDPFVSSEDACVLFSICLAIFMQQRSQCGRVVAMDEAHKFLAKSGEAQNLTEDLVSIIRQQRHTGTRVFISTQEPTLSPKLIDLANATFVHRFLSPAWYEILKTHLAGAHAASRATDRHGNGGSSHSLFDTIVRLRTGDALLFCPTAYLSVDDEKGAGAGAGAVRVLGDGLAKLRIRDRVTADGGRSITAAGQATSAAVEGELPALDRDEVPMYTVSPKPPKAKAASAKKRPPRSIDSSGAGGDELEMTQFESTYKPLAVASEAMGLDGDDASVFADAMKASVREFLQSGQFKKKTTTMKTALKKKLWRKVEAAVGLDQGFLSRQPGPVRLYWDEMLNEATKEMSAELEEEKRARKKDKKQRRALERAKDDAKMNAIFPDAEPEDEVDDVLRRQLEDEFEDELKDELEDELEAEDKSGDAIKDESEAVDELEDELEAEDKSGDAIKDTSKAVDELEDKLEAEDKSGDAIKDESEAVDELEDKLEAEDNSGDAIKDEAVDEPRDKAEDSPSYNKLQKAELQEEQRDEARPQESVTSEEKQLKGADGKESA